MTTDAGRPANGPGSLTVRVDLLRAGVPVVRASGCLDRLTAPDLRQVLDEQLDAAPWAIVVDLSAVSVLQPDAVPTLVDVAHSAGEADIGLCLVAVDGIVDGALAAAGVHDLFEIHPTMEAALDALS